MTLRRLVPLLLALLAAATLVACSGGGDAATPTVPPATAPAAGAPTATETPTPEATATAGDRLPAVPGQASTATIPTDQLPITRFHLPDGSTVDLPTEVPTVREYEIGLSNRTSLDGRGMLFYYPGVRGGPGFWMLNTLIDLDVAFVDGDHIVFNIQHMKRETLDVHHPDARYLAGIEAPARWFEDHGVVVGSRVEFLFDPEALRGD